MESRAKLLGHPIHPMLIVFPVGLFVAAVICDVIFLITNNTLYSLVAFIDISGGILGGLLAAIFGLRDWLSIPGGTRAKQIGAFHGLGNVLVVVLFIISWLMRVNSANYAPSVLALIFSFAGVIVASGTAWLGGELVDRLGVGVDPGANLNAPNSLTHEAPVSPYFGAVPVTGDRDHPDIDEP